MHFIEWGVIESGAGNYLFGFGIDDRMELIFDVLTDFRRIAPVDVFK